MTFEQALLHSLDLQLAVFLALSRHDTEGAKKALTAHIQFNPYTYMFPGKLNYKVK